MRHTFLYITQNVTFNIFAFYNSGCLVSIYYHSSTAYIIAKVSSNALDITDISYWNNTAFDVIKIYWRITCLFTDITGCKVY